MQNTTYQSFLINAYAISNITLGFEKVSLLVDTQYRVHGLNVLLYKAELPETKFIISRLEQQHNTGLVTVINSTFSQFEVSSGFNIS